jgi:hypothetical protein
MTTLTASRMLIDGLSPHAASQERRAGLRAMLGRLAAVAQADTARRSITDLPSHLRRDIGLGEIDVFDL